VEQQQTTIQSNRKKLLGKIVSYRPLSLIQMDIFDMQNYTRTNKGYKYILCIIDVFTRKVWTYVMKKKDNDNVQESFKKFLQQSDIQNNTPTILMSDNDSTFINKSFQEILEKNKIIMLRKIWTCGYLSNRSSMLMMRFPVATPSECIMARVAPPMAPPSKSPVDATYCSSVPFASTLVATTVLNNSVSGEYDPATCSILELGSRRTECGD